MNINNKKLLILLMTIMLCQFQVASLKADEHSSLDDEELPAIDPFSGGVSSNQAGETDNKISSNNGLLNNMKLVGTITAENKQIAIFSAAVAQASPTINAPCATDATSSPSGPSCFKLSTIGPTAVCIAWNCQCGRAT